MAPKIIILSHAINQDVNEVRLVFKVSGSPNSHVVRARLSELNLVEMQPYVWRLEPKLQLCNTMYQSAINQEFAILRNKESLRRAKVIKNSPRRLN